MKKIIILQIILLPLWIGTGKTSDATDDQYSKYMQNDSAYVYKWDTEASDWVLSQVQLYKYLAGKLTEVLMKDIGSGVNIALSVYTYNDIGRNDTAINYSYSNGWVPSTRVTTDYDSQGRINSVRVQKLMQDVWTEDRLQQNYIYDTWNRLIGYESIYWRNNAWTLPTVSVLNYNLEGKLESQVATRPDGNIDYRIIYEYNDEGQQTQFYTQYPAGDGWSNWNLRTTQYNDCGNKISQVQYSGQGPDWIPATKTVFFTSFNVELYPSKKVDVCHNGHTITVSINALSAHLKHGDCIGECLVEKHEEDRRMNCERNSNKRTPFMVYPNPARERLTIKMTDTGCPVSRIELLEYDGRLIYSANPSDQDEISIDIRKIRSGNYILRVFAGDIYTTVVSKN